MLEDGGEAHTGVIPEALVVTRDRAHAGLTDLRVVRSMHAAQGADGRYSSDAFVALPGGWGTLEEFFEVLTWAQLGLAPQAVRCPERLRLLRWLCWRFAAHSVAEGFVRPEHGGMMTSRSTRPGRCSTPCAVHRPPAVQKSARFAQRRERHAARVSVTRTFEARQIA